MADTRLVRFTKGGEEIFKGKIISIEREKLADLSLESVRTEGFKGTVRDFKQKYRRYLGDEYWVLTFEKISRDKPEEIENKDLFPFWFVVYTKEG